MASTARWALVIAAGLALVALTDNLTPPASFAQATPGGANTENMEAWLQGTWRRDYLDGPMRIQRDLVLGPSRHFREAVRVTDAEGHTTLQEHEGHWFFDGTNLKRHYTAMDGRPPSRLNLPFATLEVLPLSRNEFEGVDHVHGHRVDYHRVAGAPEQPLSGG